MFDVDMEVVTLRAIDGVERRQPIVRGKGLALLQERREDRFEVYAYKDTGDRDAHGRRVFREPAPALRG